MSQNYTPIDHIVKNAQLEEEIHQAKAIQQTPLISGSKEAGPMRSGLGEILPVHEVVEKEDVEPDIKPFVDVKPQNIKIPMEFVKLGLQPIEKTKYADYKNIKLPISDDKIALGLHAPMSSSLRWLATLAIYILHQSHLTLKVIHGKAVRVVKR